MPRATRLVLASSLLLAALLAFMQQPAAALMYAFSKSSNICFVEEVSKKDLFITGHYNWFDHPDASLQMVLALYGVNGNLVSTETMQRGEHAFRLTVNSPELGAYKLCAEVVSPGFDPESGPPLLVEFDVDQTSAHRETAKEEKASIAKREVVDGMMVFTFTDIGGESKTVLQPRVVIERIEKGLHEVESLFNDVEEGTSYLLNREDRMRSTSESTFVRVWACAAVTIVVTVCCVFAQFRMLKRTIVKKKLI